LETHNYTFRSSRVNDPSRGLISTERCLAQPLGFSSVPAGKMLSRRGRPYCRRRARRGRGHRQPGEVPRRRCGGHSGHAKTETRALDRWHKRSSAIHREVARGDRITPGCYAETRPQRSRARAYRTFLRVRCSTGWPSFLSSPSTSLPSNPYQAPGCQQALTSPDAGLSGQRWF
jgi:hypothetical protein